MLIEPVVFVFMNFLYQKMVQIIACEIIYFHRMRNCISLIHRNWWADPSSTINNQTWDSSSGKKGQNALISQIKIWYVHSLKHYLSKLMSWWNWAFRAWDKKCFTLSDQTRMLLRCYSKLAVINMVQDLLHILPILYETMLDGIFQEQDILLFIGIVSNVGITMFHTHHNWWKFWFANNWRKLRAWSIFSWKARLSQSCSCINYNSFDHLLVRVVIQFSVWNFNQTFQC